MRQRDRDRATEKRNNRKNHRQRAYTEKNKRNERKGRNILDSQHTWCRGTTAAGCTVTLIMSHVIYYKNCRRWKICAAWNMNARNKWPFVVYWKWWHTSESIDLLFLSRWTIAAKYKVLCCLRSISNMAPSIERENRTNLLYSYSWNFLTNLERFIELNHKTIINQFEFASVCKVPMHI